MRISPWQDKTQGIVKINLKEVIRIGSSNNLHQGEC